MGFLSDYLAMMAQLNRQQESLLWWATDISSKNRFQSPVPELLSKILERGPDALPLTGGGASLSQTGRHIARWLLHAARALARMAWIKVMLGPSLRGRLKEGGAYCVVKSFLYARSFGPGSSYRDAFLGDLVDHLQAAGPLLVLVDIPADFMTCVAGLRRKAPGPLVVPWEYFLTAKDILDYTFKGLTYKPKPLSRLMFGDRDVSAALAPLLTRGRVKIQPYQLFHYPACRALCRRVQVGRFILTHESNPWEKMCILAVRRSAPGALIIGYQHNVVPEASANMFICAQELGTTPLPDRIITTGPEPKRIFEENGGFASGMIEEGCALRVEPAQTEFPPRRRVKNILVAMEGVDGAHALASYVIDQLKKEDKYQAVFRTHPVLPWGHFQRKYGCNIKPYKHFFLSKGQTLKNDILASDVVIYWGSTVGMEALGLGRPVIHFDNGSLLSFDPLFRCPHLKWTVKPGQSLPDVLSAVDRVGDADFVQARSWALEYLKSYFVPVSNECLSKFRR